MSAQPLPMNRSERRKRGDTGKRSLEDTPLMVVLVKRVERKMEDGSVVAQSFYAPVTPNGRPLMEDETPDGPVPVLLASLPVVVKGPSLIVTAPGLVRV